MKKTYLLLFLTAISFTLLAFQCDEESISTREEDETRLSLAKSEIEELADKSVCNESAECKFIGLGSKPCGGPWSYLVYSTSIDTERLENLVEIYNLNEDEFNRKWGVVSDCAITNPPTSVNCENNICVATY